jgi:hypothetical protein
VTSRKRATRSGFEIAFKLDCGLLAGKFERYDDSPGSVAESVPRWTSVVPRQPFVHVARDPHVVSIGVALAPQNLDESLSDAEHTPTDRMFLAGQKPSLFFEIDRLRRVWYARFSKERRPAASKNCFVREVRLRGYAASARQPPREGCSRELVRQEDSRRLACLAIAHAKRERRLAPQAGFEPATLRLTGETRSGSRTLPLIPVQPAVHAPEALPIRHARTAIRMRLR